MREETSACPGTVAQQVARSAVFGDEIMKICTPLGSKECKALPQSGLWSIKCAIFKEYPQYWHCPEGFEESWKKLLNRHVTQKHSPTFILCMMSFTRKVMITTIQHVYNTYIVCKASNTPTAHVSHHIIHVYVYYIILCMCTVQ